MMLELIRGSTVPCKNHPNAPAIENCARCDTPMCGMCANFTEAGVFCDSCESAIEAERAVETRTKELDPQIDPILAESPVPEDPDLAIDRRSGKRSGKRGETVFLFGAGGLTLAIYVVMFLYSHPGFLDFNSEERAAQLALDSFEDCLAIFQEIGEALEVDETPDLELLCDDSLSPNIVTRDGDEIRIAHPNPSTYGYSELFVTNIDHEPIATEI